jgi:hypothetical protein
LLEPALHKDSAAFDASSCNISLSSFLWIAEFLTLIVLSNNDSTFEHKTVEAYGKKSHKSEHLKLLEAFSLIKRNTGSLL